VADRYDVVVVGGGIAGAALGARLAQQGLGVLVLEQQQSYKDKVRGEVIQPWGVREVVRLGIEQVLLDAGGQYASAIVPYDETLSPQQAEEQAIPFELIAGDVPGALNVGHPEACEALITHADASGATVVRGAGKLKVTLGREPTVEWANGNGAQHASCRLVVGADGRGSAVRRQAGIELHEREAVIYGAGLLVRANTSLGTRNVLGTEDDALYLAFPRHDLARLYLMVDIARQRDFTGPGRLDRFLAAFRATSFPASVELTDGEPVGPCGGAPMTDSWTEGPPVVDGLVLVGDAAGWNDPIIGQGLSIALRDARTVADIIGASNDWSPNAFASYVDERAERMRLLAICARIATEMRCTFTPAGRERRSRWLGTLMSDPIMLMQAAIALTGPETAPPDAFTDEAVEQTFAI
jgi:2-polyprenyl-6-methoxyphenol hydroxylase-like FAD-dependent oxidoreductase